MSSASADAARRSCRGSRPRSRRPTAASTVRAWFAARDGIRPAAWRGAGVPRLRPTRARRGGSENVGDEPRVQYKRTVLAFGGGRGQAVELAAVVRRAGQELDPVLDPVVDVAAVEFDDRAVGDLHLELDGAL